MRAQQAPNQGFLAVLYPRKSDQSAPVCTPLAGGKGVKVVTTRGTDWIFLGQKPVKWSGEGLSFSGTAGAIRKARSKWTVEFFEPGEAAVNGNNAGAERPREVAM